MSETVFWSWQSDRDERVTRHLIREAIVIALDRMSGASDIEERLEIDHDTRGLPGSPDIVSAILEKIERSAVFVADITPIGLAENGKQLPNPNVLIELGYAKRAISPARVVTVWNTAFTGPKPEDLPFDLRFRRGPITYTLRPDADKAELAQARAHLVKEFTQRIGACLDHLPKILPDLPEWQPSADGDPSTWVPAGAAINLNEGWGSGQKELAAGPRWYARILPSSFDPSNQDQGAYGPLVSGYGGFSCGRTTGGVLTYSGSVRTGSSTKTLDGATMWFRRTGEIWATQSGISTNYQGYPTFLGDYIAAKWAEILRRSLSILHENGGSAPYMIRLGVTGLDGLHWSNVQTFGGAPPIALEGSLEVEFTVQGEDRELWLAEFLDAWAQLRRVFSLPPPEPNVVEETMRKYG
jgi:hypothetical protein